MAYQITPFGPSLLHTRQPKLQIEKATEMQLDPTSARCAHGIVYIAWGDKFVKEAIASAISLKQHCDYPIVLMTMDDSSIPADIFTDIMRLPLASSYKDKILMRHSPFQKTLFLDTDTIIIEDISELFSLLDRFDFFYQAADGGLHYAIPDMPMHAFPEPSAGVLGWRQNNKTDELFNIWADEYDVQERLHGPGAWDQRSLRAALWRSQVSMTALQGTWQLYAWISTPLLGPVRILHGRGKQIQTLARHANFSLGYRIYIPRIGMMSFHGIDPKEYLRLVSRATIIIARRLARLLLAKIGIWRLPNRPRPM